MLLQPTPRMAYGKRVIYPSLWETSVRCTVGNSRNNVVDDRYHPVVISVGHRVGSVGTAEAAEAHVDAGDVSNLRAQPAVRPKISYARLAKEDLVEYKFQ